MGSAWAGGAAVGPEDMALLQDLISRWKTYLHWCYSDGCNVVMWGAHRHMKCVWDTESFFRASGRVFLVSSPFLSFLSRHCNVLQPCSATLLWFLSLFCVCFSSHQSCFHNCSLLEENRLFPQFSPLCFVCHALFSACHGQSEPRHWESQGHLNFASEDKCIGGHTCGWEAGVGLESWAPSHLSSLLQSCQL